MILGSFIDYVNRARLDEDDGPIERPLIEQILPPPPNFDPPICAACGISGHSQVNCLMSPCHRLAAAVHDPSGCECGFPASMHREVTRRRG